MKIIYYRTLLNKAKGLSPNERILYCFLVSKSITDCHELFDSDGQTINQDSLKELLCYDHYLELKPMSCTKIARELCITKQGVINAENGLIQHKILFKKENNALIYVNENVFKRGYFELQGKEKLKGDLLIFYSYLLDKSKKYDYCIDTFKYKLAEDLGRTTVAITKLLNRLYREGLAKRLENGKLKINKL